jgi:hypothetical protein
MAFVVVYDTCALYGNTPRDLLIRVAQAGMVQAKWSEDILDFTACPRRGYPVGRSTQRDRRP